ncbi:MAG: PadR family transcriptional regulator [Saccharofermentans sp.]|nr:PadR family transcriptional regulator [Saccharofermentans sp.]
MNSQFKKGVLDMCVLAILDKGDSYGYDVADALSSSIELADGTVYPILRKLASDGSVTTYLKESQNGPPRKYYHLTPIGRNRLEQDKKEWRGFAKAVDEIIGEEGHYEQTGIPEEA